jgi:ubiquinone/menaquinone biosynthesis C-methylase UbiE
MLSEVFYELFSDIPRQGPGSDEYTRKAYMSLPDLALQPNILDVGCGSGMQTLELARISTGTITALDNYQPFLDDLRRRAQSAGLDNKIDILNGSMFELPFARGTFDLIWSEGANLHHRL